MAKKKYPWTGNALIERAKRGGEIPPLLYIFGDDPYQVRGVVEQLKARIQPAFKDFNLHQVTAGETNAESIVSLANQLPVMDACTLVLVREVQNWSAADWKPLLAYLESPSETTCLAFLSTEPKPISGKLKAGQLLSSYLVACLKPYERQMPAWLAQRAKYHGLRLSPEASYRILELLGNDLTALNNALERIALFIGGEGHVSLDVVNQTVASDRDFSAFDLASFVGHRNTEQALRYLRGILGKGEPPLRLLGLLVSTFRKLLRGRVDLDAGAPPQALDKYIPPSLRFHREQHLRSFIEQVRCFSLDELIAAFSLMHQADLAMKSTSGLTEDMIMERLILELCQLQR